jgi:hypothetical protein
LTINGSVIPLGGTVTVGDITGITAGTGLTGGGTAGEITINANYAAIGSAVTITQSQVTNLTTDLAAKANLAGPTFTGTVTLPSTTSIGNVSSTELGFVDGVTSAIQTQINAKANTAGPTFSGTVTLPSTTSIGNVSSTEIGYLDGVTSALQTQIDGKQATITGGATTITSSNLTASRALIANSSGKVAVSTVTDTELAFLAGVTSALQTQLNGKAASNATITINGTAVTIGGSITVNARLG